MFVLFDLSSKDLIRVVLFDETGLHEKKEEARNKELLAVFDSFLVEKKLSKKDVQGIMVVVGSGGFTSTRLAVTVANTFGYALHIPLLAISEAEAADPQALLTRLLAQPPGQLISPTYSGEANIGGEKK